MKSNTKKLEYNRLYREKNRLIIREKKKAMRMGMKLTVLNHYGKQCKHCDFDDIRALQIDHINDDGAEERKSLGGKQISGWRFYDILIKRGLPEGYQTLCANCNNIKQWERNNRD